jgi:hypothetical protein
MLETSNLLVAAVLLGIIGCAGAREPEHVVAEAAIRPATAAASHPSIAAEITGPDKQGGLLVYRVSSDYQEQPVNLYLLLPDQLDKSHRYKVLYILPAWAASRDGLNLARKLDVANKYHVICVGPDFCRMPWYADNDKNPKMRYDSYIPDIVVPFIDRTYPTVAAPEGRIVMGFSKSGLGALSLLLRHPDVFGRAGSWDGLLINGDNRPEFYGSAENLKANYYLPDLIRRQADTFRNKPARMAIMGRGFGTSARFHKVLDELSISHFCDESIQPNHEWNPAWMAPMVEVLLSDDMAKAKPTTVPAEPKRAAPRP